MMNSSNTKDHEVNKILVENSCRVEAVKNGNVEMVSEEPSTKSFRRWFVVLASFTCNGLIFGLINSVSVIYNELQENLVKNGVENASTKACK